MKQKLIVVAHGIGDHAAGFSEEWEGMLRKNHPKAKFRVAEFVWEDILEKAEKQYPACSKQATAAFNRLGFGLLQIALNNDAYKSISDGVMDILTYVLLGDMNRYMRARCSVRLEELRIKMKAAKEDIVLIGHSLGAAMLPHIVWDYYRHVGAIPWHGLILLASPLGYQSPFPEAIADPLAAMIGDHANLGRTDVLREFSKAWRRRGEERLHFLINKQDLVCWDAEYDGTGDPLSFIRQGFSPAEMAALSEANPNCLHLFTTGKPKLNQIAANHSIALYLNRPEFIRAFNRLLAT
jgi:hypothetical protein